jgi:hypothetical protein
MTDRLVNFSKFFLNLPVNLQDEFSEYLSNVPAVTLIVQRTVIDTLDITKLKERILHDYSKQAFSEELKNTMIAALDNLGN